MNSSKIWALHCSHIVFQSMESHYSRLLLLHARLHNCKKLKQKQMIRRQFFWQWVKIQMTITDNNIINKFTFLPLFGVASLSVDNWDPWFYRRIDEDSSNLSAVLFRANLSLSILAWLNKLNLSKLIDDVNNYININSKD